MALACQSDVQNISHTCTYLDQKMCIEHIWVTLLQGQGHSGVSKVKSSTFLSIPYLLNPWSDCQNTHVNLDERMNREHDR